MVLDGGYVKMENFKIEKEILPVLEKLRYCGSVVPCYNCSYSMFFEGTRPRLPLGLVPSKNML